MVSGISLSTISQQVDTLIKNTPPPPSHLRSAGSGKSTSRIIVAQRKEKCKPGCVPGHSHARRRRRRRRRRKRTRKVVVHKCPPCKTTSCNVEKLIYKLKTAKPGKVAQVAKKLGGIIKSVPKTKSSIAILVEMLSHKNPVVQRNALLTLSHIVALRQKSEPSFTLQKLIAGNGPSLLNMRFASLKGPSGVAKLMKPVKVAVATPKKCAAPVKTRGMSSTAKLLLEKLKSKEVRVRQAAAHLLENMRMDTDTFAEKAMAHIGEETDATVNAHLLRTLANCVRMESVRNYASTITLKESTSTAVINAVKLLKKAVKKYNACMLPQKEKTDNANKRKEALEKIKKYKYLRKGMLGWRLAGGIVAGLTVRHNMERALNGGVPSAGLYGTAVKGISLDKKLRNLVTLGFFLMVEPFKIHFGKKWWYTMTPVAGGLTLEWTKFKKPSRSYYYSRDKEVGVEFRAGYALGYTPVREDKRVDHGPTASLSVHIYVDNYLSFGPDLTATYFYERNEVMWTLGFATFFHGLIHHKRGGLISDY